ncbi:MAG: sn-glycerol-3-phosphate ABC transporter ATP-binding protein UgpC [Paracoccaceae bacterium]
MTELILDSISKTYGNVTVIPGMDMHIPSGEFCVFVGPSGCGKSTLLRMISGLEDISGGEIRLDGACVNGVPAAQRGLAMVFQSYALYPHMTVRKNLSFGLENMKTPRPEIERRVQHAAQMLQIEPYLDRRPGQLSGGQRQRVAIGRAVVREPRVFLFDEPLSNLDAELRVTMRREIAALHRRLGNTMIYVTHDQVEAMTMADKIAVLRAGKLEQFGAPLDLFNRPANRFVAGFIGSPSMNFLKGRIAGDGVLLDQGATIRLARRPDGAVEGEPVELGIRPRDLAFDPEGPLTLSVAEVEQLGGESHVFGAIAGGETLALHQPGQTRARIGENLRLTPDPAAIHLFRQSDGLALR